MKKQYISILAVAALVLSLVSPLSALAQEYPALTLDEEVTVEISVGGSAWYQFTPDVTATYWLESSNASGVDPVAKLYNSSMELLAEDDDHEAPNFRITAQLTSGETYYLEAFEFNKDEAGSYSLIVCKGLPTDIFFDEYSMDAFVGTKYTLTANVYPEDVDRTMTWSSSDESVATVDENGTITFLAAGEVTITAKTANGLYDNCYFTVYPVHGSLQLNDKQTMTYTGFETRAETQRYFTFTPEETGYYRLVSDNIVSEIADTPIDPRVWVYNARREELEYDDDGGEDVNVSIDAALEANETYYFMLELYDSEAVGSFDYVLKEIDTAESVKIDCDDLVLNQGDAFDIYVTFAPAGSWQEDYTVTSSDSSVVSVQDKAILAVGAGEATITVTTEFGLTDSITVTVFGIDELELNTEYTLEGYGVDYGSNKTYAFTPEVAGRYTIQSTQTLGENVELSVLVKDAYNQLRYYDSDSNVFKLTYELEANTTYYYNVDLFCEADESAVSFILTKEDDSTIPTIALNKTYDAVITNASDGVYYVFEPTVTGLYRVYSSLLDGSDPVDTKLNVYNSEWEMLYSNDDGADYSQFCLEEEFVAGETYYLKAYIFSCDIVGEFSVCAEPMFEMYDKGDVNGDGTIGIADAMKAFYHVSGGLPLEGFELEAADVTGDGEVTIADAMKVFYFVNEKITEF